MQKCLRAIRQSGSFYCATITTQAHFVDLPGFEPGPLIVYIYDEPHSNYVSQKIGLVEAGHARLASAQVSYPASRLGGNQKPPLLHPSQMRRQDGGQGRN